MKENKRDIVDSKMMIARVDEDAQGLKKAFIEASSLDYMELMQVYLLLTAVLIDDMHPLSGSLKGGDELSQIMRQVKPLLESMFEIEFGQWRSK